MDLISGLSRAEKLLGGLDVANSRGLEIGALNSPMLRRPAADIRYVDHLDQDALRAKYADDGNVKPDDIVPVDAVWGENTLADCFPGERFDYVIASHVIEHVPDVIGWLGQIADVLRPEGRLILAIPDRACNFDVLRRETSLADLIEHHLRQDRRPTPGQVFDSCANTVDFGPNEAWFSLPRTTYTHFVDRRWALNRALQSRDGAYIDVHCSVFSARSLLHVLDGLLELNLLRFRVERFHIASRGGGEMSLVLTSIAQDAEDEIAAARSAIGQMLARGVDSEGLPLDAIVGPYSVAAAAAAADPEVVALRQALEDMRASSSWRLTAPLRAVARGLRRYRSADANHLDG
jgi:SAM-dependent methyltransferase